ncbi:MAG: lipopolysaccharide transport periplasmic protein LptA [Luteimonas sp.]
MFRPIDAILLFAMLSVAGGAFARTSDRNQPMDAESDQNSCILSDAGQCVMTGNVRITQGSLDITAAKAVIYRANGDISRAVLTGGPAVLKQQMDDGTPMTAHAANVDYNLQNEVVVFTGNVELQQPRGTMNGQRVVYNLKTGAIDSGGSGSGRVKMRIMPKNAAPAAATETPAAAPTAETAPPKTTP